MAEPENLFIIWSSGDREVALHNVFMYARNSRKQGWWNQVRFIVWGPSAKLVLKDLEVQQRFLELKEHGVELLACKACTDNYGLTAQLEALGVDVIYVGQLTTQMLKSGWTSLTY
jgi:hypothetical protein